MNVTATKPKTTKMLLQLLFGAVAGAAGMIGMLTALESVDGLLDDGARLFALATAMVYLLMAAVVALGTALPKVGAKTLNVEDSEELTEQRATLLVSSLTFVLIAAFLGAIALAEGTSGIGLFGNGPAAALALVTGAGLTFLSVRYRRMGDEMMRLVAHEANSIMVGLLFLTAVAASAAAQLGYAAPLAPLTLIAGFFALYLLSIFVAVGLRGMLKPR